MTCFALSPTAILFAADPTTSPVRPVQKLYDPSAEPDDQDPHEKVWSFTGMHGTAEEIRKQLAVEVDHFNDVISDCEAGIIKLDADMEEQRAVLAKTMASADTDYAYVVKTIERTQEELSQAVGTQRIAQLNAKLEGFAKRRTLIEVKALSKDARGTQLLAEKTQKLELIEGAKKGLKSALDWRREVGHALRGTMALRWPLAPGKVGTPGEIKVTAYDRDSDTLTAEGKLFDPLPDSTERLREGIRYSRGQALPTTFTIKGLGITSVEVGKVIYCDRAVSVISAERTDNAAVVSVQKKRHPMDELLAVFREYCSLEE